MSDVGFREPWRQPPALATLTESPEIRHPKSEIFFLLSPISAMKTVPAAVRLPAGRNPDSMPPGRPDPITAHPVPISAAPIPESVHPTVAGAGRNTHDAD